MDGADDARTWTAELERSDGNVAGALVVEGRGLGLIGG
jgi:hypothetical protein